MKKGEKEEKYENVFMFVPSNFCIRDWKTFFTSPTASFSRKSNSDDETPDEKEDDEGDDVDPYDVIEGSEGETVLREEDDDDVSPIERPTPSPVKQTYQSEIQSDSWGKFPSQKDNWPKNVVKSDDIRWGRG